ncbi:hypothetical protein QBC43DRAFT_116611 [Cladorrhinum sp. PSN259]|nr:hypothetical protein QBC43DRAFT_116611 [Cladorrhinum sp. PSN259]
MNFTFGNSGPNLDRFNFFGRSRPAAAAANPQPQQQQPPPGPHPAFRENYNPYAFDDDNDHSDDDDRAPLSPRGPHYHPAYNPNPEMTERPAAQQSHFSRLSSYLRPSAGGFFRPASSSYSGQGLHGAPAETVIGGRGYHRNRQGEVVESPKSPDFRIGAQNLPSTRLHLPNLDRTWTLGSNGPPSREGPGQQPPVPVIQEPAPAVVAGGESERRRERRERRERRHRREGSGSSGSGRRRHRREGSGGSGSSSSRRERRHRRHRADGTTTGGTETSTSRTSSSRSSGSSRSRRGPPPKNFLFCFPWIKSRRIRSQILKCFVSGMFLASILTVYLSLALTKNINSQAFTILLVLIILAITIFFCHSLIRLCMLVVKRRKANAQGDLESGQRQRNGLPEMQPPPVFGGYAIPRQPIRVVLASDEEAAGIESAATKLNPPAYGLWRESVRVDPTRLYWQRNEGPGYSSDDFGTTSSSSSGAEQSSNGRANVPRPPSYASDDGVSYIVEARPRSTLPLPHAAGLHPAEAGRVGQPSPW